eukprot:5867830-Amphidinium_carterae.2
METSKKGKGSSMKHLPLQIMDDWAKSVPKTLDEAGKRAASDAIARQLEEFMADDQAHDEGAETRKVAEPQRVHSAHHILALEQAMQAGLNLTLAQYRCEGSFAVVRTDVKRYWTPRENLDAQLLEDGVTRRACVQLLTNKSTALTVPRESEKIDKGLASLTVVMDLGPKQFPGMQWIYEKWQLRGSLINDPWHAD